MGTWNVNGQSASESVGPWIGADKIPPDVIVVGWVWPPVCFLTFCHQNVLP